MTQLPARPAGPPATAYYNVPPGAQPIMTIHSPNFAMVSELVDVIITGTYEESGTSRFGITKSPRNKIFFVYLLYSSWILLVLPQLSLKEIGPDYSLRFLLVVK